MIERAEGPESTGSLERSIIVIDCFVPPSANRLWRVGKARQVYKTGLYRRFAWEFFVHWHEQKPKGFKSIKGQFDAEILICPKRKRDCDNNSKALMDICQAIGIIANDSQARKVTQELVDMTQAPMGCRLRITPLG